MGERQPEAHRGVLEQEKGDKSDPGSQIQPAQEKLVGLYKGISQDMSQFLPQTECEPLNGSDKD